MLLYSTCLLYYLADVFATDGASTSENTPLGSKSVSKKQGTKKAPSPVAKKVVGKDAKELSGDESAQIKKRITRILAGMSYREGEHLLFQLMDDLKANSVINAS